MPLSKIQLTPVDSHVLAGYGYDPATNTMALQFNAKPGAPVRVYEYPGTSPEKFAELAGAESKGSWWYKNKTEFPVFVKTEDEPKEAADGEGSDL